METVRERLDKATASGNRDEIRRALTAAKEAGADAASIEQALAELDRVGSDSAPAPQGGAPQGGAPQGGAPPEGGAPPQGGPPQAAASGEPEPPTEQEMAERFTRADALKKKGNECLKSNTKSAAREAMEFFTAGLEVGCYDRVLVAQLFGNRAHVRILLKQFVEAVDDCRKAIEIDPKNMKSYFRAAKASLNLDLVRNAIDFCEAGLRQQPNDEDIMKLRASCAEKLTEQQKRKAEMALKQTGDFNADEAMAVQEKVSEISEQCDQMKGSLINKQRQLHKAELTEKTLGDLPADTKMYIGVGRTFVMEPRELIDNKLQGRLVKLKEDIPKLEKTHQEMERRKEEAEKELREMIQSFKQQSN